MKNTVYSILLSFVFLHWSNAQNSFSANPKADKDAQILLEKCDSLREEGLVDQAMSACVEALSVARGTQDKGAECKALVDIGRLSQNAEKSLEYTYDGLKICQMAEEKFIEGRAKQNIGAALTNLNKLEQALPNFEEALTIFTKLEKEQYQIPSLRSLAETHFRLNNFEKACEIAQTLNKIGLKNNDKLLEGESYFMLARCQEGLKEFEAAAHLFKKSLEIARQKGDKRGEVFAAEGRTRALVNTNADKKEVENASQQLLDISEETNYISGKIFAHERLGKSAQLNGNDEDAIKHYNAALKILDAVDDKPRKASIFLEIGKIRLKQQQSNIAFQAFDAAFEISKTTYSLKTIEMEALGMMGTALGAHDLPHEATKHFLQAHEIAKETNNKAFAANLLQKMAMNTLVFTNYDLAFQYIQESLELSQAIKNPVLEAEAYNLMAMVYDTRGYFSEAIECLNQAATIYKTLAQLIEAGRIYQSLSRFYFKHHKTKEALQYLGEAEALFKSNNANVDFAAVLENYAEYEMKNGKLKEAAEYYNRAIVTYSDVSDIRRRIDAIAGLARCYMEKEQYDLAENLLIETIEIAAEKRFPMQQFKNLQLGELYHKQKKYQQAIQTYKAAVAKSTHLNTLAEYVAISNLFTIAIELEDLGANRN